ncbi:FAD-binding protein [Rhizobium sp. R72]|uniref:protoporphyrinogen/coproporphyrinogen oxidase n=1 Tax=unclassified Rhizobium TaxID=2613769 RepID=UPI000B535975|nr:MULTISPECIES: NAD(P)-binding protein [unclassified Rhizobium]OWV98638.1 FAD-binding protein [Rhizobium sp. R72]OWV98672.1 FAD-binding protein [Rhizobium sp. R711]
MDDASPQVVPISKFPHFDAVVLGAGISGLVAASVLAKQGERTLVIDDYEHVGGNHMDWTSRDGYTFDVGSLIFQDDSPLLRHFPELLPHYLPIAPTWGRLNPQRKITEYPISVRDDILAAGPIGLMRISFSVLYARLFCKKMGNARDFARYWIGDYLLRRSGLETYMKRFYGIAPEKIDLDLARKRMGWISEHASIGTLIKKLMRSRMAAGPANRQLARPRQGFAILYDAAVERLTSAGVSLRLSAGTRKIERTNDGFEITLDGGVVLTRRVISTIPIPALERLCGLPAQTALNTITLISLYFSFAGERGFSQSIIYNFSHDGAWKRLTVYSDFYGRVNGREYFAVEVIAGDHVSSVDQGEEDFRRHTQANGLFNGDLVLEGSQVLESAYPIYSKGAAQHAAQAIEALRAFGIESIGRQGGFNYQPTARVSTIEVEAALGKN